MFKCGLVLWNTSLSSAEDRDIFLTFCRLANIIEFSDKWNFEFDSSEIFGSNRHTLLPMFKMHLELIILVETIVDILSTNFMPVQMLVTL